MITSILVDDESKSREALTTLLLERHFDIIHILALCNSVAAAEGLPECAFKIDQTGTDFLIRKENS